MVKFVLLGQRGVEANHLSTKAQPGLGSDAHTYLQGSPASIHTCSQDR